LPVKLLQLLARKEVVVHPLFDAAQLDKSGRIVFSLAFMIKKSKSLRRSAT
jgi:hypothetical protein